MDAQRESEANAREAKRKAVKFAEKARREAEKQNTRFGTLKWKPKESAVIKGDSCNLPKLRLKSGSNNLPTMHCAIVKRADLLN